MGSPLGPLFANFYMSSVEKKVLTDRNIASHIYCRYVDDVFVDVQDVEQLHHIIEVMQQGSVLKFTYELREENKIPFLDVLVHNDGGKFDTTVHRKATDAGRCLNARSECPSRYKTSVIRSFIRRAVRYCSTWPDLHVEFTRIKQILVNNGYSNTEVDDEIRTFLERIDRLQERKRAQTKTMSHYIITSGARSAERVLLWFKGEISVCAAQPDPTRPHDAFEKLISLERVDRFTSGLLCSMSPFNKFRI